MTSDGVSITRDKAGRWRFLGVPTNNFRDRDGEVFTEAAHREYVGWADRTGDYPELRLWHAPYGIGDVDMLDYADGFMLASGTFRPGMEGVAARLAAEPGLGMSHGYTYGARDLKGGAYGSYRTFEVSVLPRARAANDATMFAIGAKEAMMMTGEKRAFLVRTLGEEAVRELEQQLAGTREALVARGVDFKDRGRTPAYLSGYETDLRSLSGGKDAQTDAGPLEFARSRGLTASDVADALGLSRQRVYQILGSDGEAGQARVRDGVVQALQRRGESVTAEAVKAYEGRPLSSVDQWISDLASGRVVRG